MVKPVIKGQPSNIQRTNVADQAPKPSGNAQDASVPTGESRNSVVREELIHAAMTLFKKLSSGESAPHRKGRRYPNAFNLSEEIIKKINEKINEKFKHLKILDSSEIVFSGKVRFPDLTTREFNSLENLLADAGNAKDPESATFSWTILLRDPLGSQAKVEVKFVTEQQLQTEEKRLFNFPLAYMELNVFGSQDNWVEDTFYDLNPFMEICKLGELYEPFLIFRNKFVVVISGLMIATAGFIISTDQIRKLLTKWHEQEWRSVIDNIISLPNIELKFNAWMRYIYEPSRTAWWEPVIILGSGAIVFLAIFTIASLVIPKLVPRSAIAIGLSHLRYVRYDIVFRYLLLTILVGSIIIPLLRTFL